MLKVLLSLFLPNGKIVLITLTVVCLIYTNVGLIHAIVLLLSHIFMDFRRFPSDELPQRCSNGEG